MTTTIELKPESGQKQGSAQCLVDEPEENAGKENFDEIPEPQAEVTLRARAIGSVLLSGSLAALATIPALQFQYWEWLALGLASPVALWGAWPFHRAALLSLRQAAATTDTLVSLGVVVSYTWGALALFLGEVGGSRAHLNQELVIPQGFATSQIYLEVAAILTTVLLIGRYWEARGERRARSALQAVLHVGGDTQREQLAHLLATAQNDKLAVQQLVERISAIFAPMVIATAVAAFSFWLGTGASLASAIAAAVAVLIVAGPGALSLAIPTALLVGLGRGAQLGILIKNPRAIESTCRIDTMVLEKTSTISIGTGALGAVISAEGDITDEVLRYAGAVEAASGSQIAQAITDAAREKFETLPPVYDFTPLSGHGATGTVEGQNVVVGDSQLFAKRGLAVPDVLATVRAQAAARGETAVLVGWKGHARGVLSVKGGIKPAAVQAIAELKALRVRTLLLTSDNTVVARTLVDRIGADGGIAEVLPDDKATAVKRLQAEGKVVALVGDGVNDAAALAQADVGIAMNAGSDSAIHASDVTVVQGDLRTAVDATRLSRRTVSTIKGNLLWAVTYNIIAIPLAAAGLITPLLAAAVTVFSGAFVIVNSLRLFSFTSVRGRKNQ